MPRMRPRLLFIAVTVLALLAGPALADTIVVDPGGGGDSTTIQGGIDAASIGDVVQVAPGTYTEDVNFMGKPVEVVSTGGAASTFIVGGGEGPVVVFETGEGPGAVLSGFDISSGNGMTGGALDGGCVHVSAASPTLEDLVLHACAAHRGGGIALIDSSATLSGIEFYDNLAVLDSSDQWGFGGGLYARESDLVLEDLSFHDNQAARGGGAMFQLGTTSISDSTIENNAADRGAGASFREGLHELTDVDVTGNVAATHSGGLWVSTGGTLTLDAVTLTGNQALYGGGLRLSDAASGTAVGCSFIGNVASGDTDPLPSGGGFRVDLSSTLFISDSYLQGNSAAYGGGGMASQATLTVTTSRFTGNTSTSSGAGLYLSESTSQVTAATFDSNEAAADGGGIRVQGGNLTASASLFVDNSAANGAGIHLYSGAEGELSHLTMVGNAASAGGSVRVTADSDLTLEDSIVAFPSAGSCISGAEGATWVIRYNDVFSASGPEWSGGLADLEGQYGNISESPGFVAYVADGVYDGDNLQLTGGSPCVDAADSSGPADPDGSAPDMGAYGGADAVLWEAPTDADGDGWSPQAGDCDDSDPDVHPGAPEECNGHDDDCDGGIDEGCGDDDDSAGDDDDAVDDDDSAADDDDDAVDDDDDDSALGDDDDSVLLVPETTACDCQGSLAGRPLTHLGLLALLLVPVLTRARRRVRSPGR